MKSTKKDSFQKGDLIVGKIMPENYEYKVGDIITYKDDINDTKTYITHRIIKIENDMFITKGDNLDICKDIDESRKTKEDIICLYKFKIKKLGIFIDFIKTKPGFFLFIILPMLIYIVVQIYKIIKMYVKFKKELT